jgi:hypothetical protein
MMKLACMQLVTSAIMVAAFRWLLLPLRPQSPICRIQRDRHLAVISAAVEHIEDNQAVSDASGQAMQPTPLPGGTTTDQRLQVTQSGTSWPFIQCHAQVQAYCSAARGAHHKEGHVILCSMLILACIDEGRPPC